MLPQEILIEEFVVGNEYSVETFGRLILGITRKHVSPPPLFVEIGHDFPACLDHDAERAISNTALDALCVMEMNWGPAHVELVMTDRGPVIIEINPRLAGGFIPELVRQATGIDLIRQTVLAVAGQEVELNAERSACASIRFVLAPGDGVVAQIGGVDQAEEVAGVTQVQMYRSPNDHVAVHGDFRDRIGHVIASGTVRENVCSAVDRAINAINVRLI
jgi:biotin carboxylase